VHVAEHGSTLLRQLVPEQMDLQHNKVTNLRLAAACVDRLVIGPGETFSFNRVVGNATRRRGFVEGMRLSAGRPVTGVGGGLCQLANLLHWLVLHSDLTVVERSEHSVDPFPDDGRVVPWGVGCTIVYNYVDLVVRNDTTSTFQLRAWVDDAHLHGELLADRAQRRRWAVEAREEEFVRRGAEVFRRNELWRRAIDPRTGEPLTEELVKRNCALVLYPLPAGAVVRDV
jgi:vancomycin resistance protein VanW